MIEELLKVFSQISQKEITHHEGFPSVVRTHENRHQHFQLKLNQGLHQGLCCLAIKAIYPFTAVLTHSYAQVGHDRSGYVIRVFL